MNDVCPPEKFMNAEMLEAKRNRKERMFHGTCLATTRFSAQTPPSSPQGSILR